MSNFLKLNAKDVLGAVLSAVIVAVLGYLSNLTNIFDANWQQILDISVLTAITSLLKSLGTDSGGKFLGGLKIK